MAVIPTATNKIYIMQLKAHFIKCVNCESCCCCTTFKWCHHEVFSVWFSLVLTLVPCPPLRALLQADVILLIGARLNWILHFGLPPRFDPIVKIIQVCLSPSLVLFPSWNPAACLPSDFTAEAHTLIYSHNRAVTARLLLSICRLTFVQKRWGIMWGLLSLCWETSALLLLRSALIFSHGVATNVVLPLLCLSKWRFYNYLLILLFWHPSE